ncbi:hypothetical protein Q7C36_012474 [Tachysurus vachellii]|uniref:Uncharacterized protein n=1 Tax=Tachysurus vachellii TaxID=175792 RepID=A0AA88MLA5_TACVA|nr:hypothetical protein Q7C36_012474 [Tachysurus vachellii]
MKTVTFIPIILIIHTTVKLNTLTIIDHQEGCPLTAILNLTNLSNLSRMTKRAFGHDYWYGLECCSCSVQKGSLTLKLYLSLHYLILISARRVSSLTWWMGRGWGERKYRGEE